jgi:single-stranded-DNA-specific exonuclease
MAAVPPERIWKIGAPSAQASILAQEAGISPLQARLLVNRGISEPEAARAFLSPLLSGMHDPSLLRDLREAGAIILRAVDAGRPVVIYGDYDADGLCASALLNHFFASIGIPVSCYIPHRIREGYGLNKEAVRKIAGRGPGCLVTVDCGSTAREEIALAQGLGMDVVVTDHHQVPSGFRPACPVVNPQRPDCPFPFKDLAGVGVAFFLAVALRRALRERGAFSGGREPDLRGYLDLVALGTVADRMPLLDQNRIFVTHGLAALSRTSWEGLRALKAASELSAPELTAHDLAFRMAPRLNAPGRVAGAEPALEMLLATDPGVALRCALTVNRANQERQDLERRVLEAAEAQLARGQEAQGRKILFLVGQDWHPGVLGIVASRLVDRYHRPAFVCTAEDGKVLGSARSIDGFHVHRALHAVGHLLERFGGHAHAAGFAFRREHEGALQLDLERQAATHLTEEMLRPGVPVDGELALDDIGTETVEEIARLAPFGEGNPEPLFLARGVEVLESRVIGDGHLKLRVRQGRRALEAVAFGMADRPAIRGSRLDLLFVPEINAWKGLRSLRLRLAHFAPAGVKTGATP